MKKLLFILLASGFLALPANAGLAPVSCPAKPSDSTGGFTVPDAWKSKFPFDLVYPISSPHSDLSSKCPKITLWGIDYELCSAMMLTQIAKTVFIVKLGINFLTNG
jgi:hypothetical protein